MKLGHQQIYACGIVLFLFPVLFLILSSFFFAFGYSLQGWLLIPSSLGAFVAVNYFSFEERLSYSAIVLISFFLMLSFIVSHLFFDVSFDGQWYHQDAIIFLNKGWNPFWNEPIQDAQVSGLNANWVNCYPKAAWIFQAGVLDFTNDIELGKALHPISNLSFACLLYSFLKRHFSISTLNALLFTLLICSSTITLGQLFSFYVDGILFSFLGIFLLLWVECLISEKPFFLWVFLSFLFLINLKFTGLVYALIFCAFGILFKGLVDYAIPRKLILNAGLMLLVGVLFIGYPTYVRNTLEKGHIFYPIMGKNNEGKAVAEVQYPKDFFGINRFQKAWRAHGSLPIYTDHEHPSIKKPLFTRSVLKSCMPYYRNHQPVTISPFGPFEAELWLFFIPLVLIFLWRKPSWKWWLMLSSVIVSLLIQPEFWNLRYAPQTLLLIGLVCLALILDVKPWVRLTSIAFMLLFLVNSYLAVYQNWLWVSTKSSKLKYALESQAGKMVKIQRGWMKSFELKLIRYNITPDYGFSPETLYQNYPEDSFTGWKMTLKNP